MKNRDRQIEDLLLSLYDSLLAQAWSMLGDIDQARDAVQDVSLAIWERRETLDTIDNKAGYIYTSLCNHCRNQIRNRSRSQQLIRPLDEDYCGAAPSTDPYGVDALLEPLDERQRQVVTLHDIEGYNCQEIAARIGKSLDTVKKYLAKSHQILMNHGRH